MHFDDAKFYEIELPYDACSEDGGYNSIDYTTENSKEVNAILHTLIYNYGINPTNIEWRIAPCFMWKRRHYGLGEALSFNLFLMIKAPHEQIAKLPDKANNL